MRRSASMPDRPPAGENGRPYHDAGPARRAFQPHRTSGERSAAPIARRGSSGPRSTSSDGHSQADDVSPRAAAHKRAASRSLSSAASSSSGASNHSHSSASASSAQRQRAHGLGDARHPAPHQPARQPRTTAQQPTAAGRVHEGGPGTSRRVNSTDTHRLRVERKATIAASRGGGSDAADGMVGKTRCSHDCTGCKGGCSKRFPPLNPPTRHKLYELLLNHDRLAGGTLIQGDAGDLWTGEYLQAMGQRPNRRRVAGDGQHCDRCRGRLLPCHRRQKRGSEARRAGELSAFSYKPDALHRDSVHPASCPGPVGKSSQAHVWRRRNTVLARGVPRSVPEGRRRRCRRGSRRPRRRRRRSVGLGSDCRVLQSCKSGSLALTTACGHACAVASRTIYIHTHDAVRAAAVSSTHV